MNDLFAADHPDLSFLQNPQQLGLHIRRHVGNLVKKQGAVVGNLKEALLVAGRPGEGSFYMAEELALHEVHRDRCAILADEFLLTTRAVTVNRGSNQLLAGATLPEYENRNR